MRPNPPSGHHSGDEYRPANKTLLLGLWRMKKRKGWSAMKVGVILMDRIIMMPAVAAAASVPSSLTSTKALWTTLDSTRLLAVDMPVREEEEEKEEMEELGFPTALWHT